MSHYVKKYFEWKGTSAWCKRDKCKIDGTKVTHNCVCETWWPRINSFVSMNICHSRSFRKQGCTVNEINSSCFGRGNGCKMKCKLDSGLFNGRWICLMRVSRLPTNGVKFKGFINFTMDLFYSFIHFVHFKWNTHAKTSKTEAIIFGSEVSKTQLQMSLLILSLI